MLSFTPEVLAKRRVDARLPAGSAGSEPIDHVLIETQRNELFGGIERRSATTAPDQRIADPKIGLVEPLVGQLRYFVVFLGPDLVLVNLGQVAVDNRLVLCHSPSS